MGFNLVLLLEIFQKLLNNYFKCVCKWFFFFENEKRNACVNCYNTITVSIITYTIICHVNKETRLVISVLLSSKWWEFVFVYTSRVLLCLHAIKRTSRIFSFLTWTNKRDSNHVCSRNKCNIGGFRRDFYHI